MIAGAITPESLSGLPDSALVLVRVRIHEQRGRVEQIELRAGLLRRLFGYFVDLTRPLVFKAGRLRAYQRTPPLLASPTNRLSQPLADMVEKRPPKPSLVRWAPRDTEALLALGRTQQRPEDIAHPRISVREFVSAEATRINAAPPEQRRVSPLLSSIVNRNNSEATK